MYSPLGTDKCSYYMVFICLLIKVLWEVRLCDMMISFFDNRKMSIFYFVLPEITFCTAILWQAARREKQEAAHATSPALLMPIFFKSLQVHLVAIGYFINIQMVVRRIGRLDFPLSLIICKPELHSLQQESKDRWETLFMGTLSDLGWFLNFSQKLCLKKEC